jgi:hypothetical protein
MSRFGLNRRGGACPRLNLATEERRVVTPVYRTREPEEGERLRTALMKLNVRYVNETWPRKRSTVWCLVCQWF